jgi:hypothetical protein
MQKSPWIIVLLLISYASMSLADTVTGYEINLILFKQPETHESRRHTEMLPPLTQTQTRHLSNRPEEIDSFTDAFQPIENKLMQDIQHKLPADQIIIAGTWHVSAEELAQSPQAWRIESDDINPETDTPIFGGLTLKLKNYFDFDFDLSTKEVESPIRLHQIRRLKSKQLNYIDHPQIGIFLYIEPTPNHIQS